MEWSPSGPKLSKILSGVSGEYFVAAELSRRGYIASITLRNSRGIDILCATEDRGKAAPGAAEDLDVTLGNLRQAFEELDGLRREG